MKVVILAGGRGTRISEDGKSMPKPLVKIGNKPILFHLMNIYAKQGFNDFIIAGGYKFSHLSKYFNSKSFPKEWKINLVNTKVKSMTGGRILLLKKYIKNSSFFCTYGDGIADIDLAKLVKLHNKFKKIATITAVRPPARFGEILIKNNLAHKFKEKPQTNSSWINGGFFIFTPKIFDFIKNAKVVLEAEPLENIAKKKQLVVYKHYKEWHCMDTPRDRDLLNKLYKNKKLNWVK
jgi:glucose-1-phosphate cytidylyltransferase